MPQTIDSAAFRHVLGHYPTGVCIVSAMGVDEIPVGMVVGSFTSVSLDPPLVAFLPGRQSHTWNRIAEVGRFCVNVLASDQLGLCRRFSTSGRNKFDKVSHRLSGNGSPILDDVVAWIDCDLEVAHEAGDHFISVGRVKELKVERAAAPLLFCQSTYGEFSVLDSFAAG